MMKKYVLAIFLALLTVSSWAQQKSIKILVVDESGAPLSYFNVLVFNPSDYIYITGEVFYEGDLDYENSFTGMKIIKITSLGYKDYALNIDFDNPVYPDKVVMQTTALEIDEVIVEGRRVALKVDKGKTILQVAGSSLANLADIATIINHAPGL